MSLSNEERVLEHKRDEKRREAINQIRRALLTAADGIKCLQEADAIDEKLKQQGLAYPDKT